MSTEVEFYKSYTRQSRSPWNDVARVVMLFHPDSKQGVYLHLGNSGINGLSVSKELQLRLPKALQSQYISPNNIDVVMHVFSKEIEDYCNAFVKEIEFKNIFLVNQTSFFSQQTKNVWKAAYNQYLASL